MTLENCADIHTKPGSLKEDRQYSESQDQSVQGVSKAEVHDSSFPVISQKVPSLPNLKNPDLDPTMLALFFPVVSFMIRYETAYVALTLFEPHAIFSVIPTRAPLTGLGFACVI